MSVPDFFGGGIGIVQVVDQVGDGLGGLDGGLAQQDLGAVKRGGGGRIVQIGEDRSVAGGLIVVH